MKCSNDLIREVFALTQQMFSLSNEGTALASDDGCRLLYSILGDCAYKIRLEAKREKESHLKKGKWDERKEVVDHDEITGTKENERFS